MGCSMCAHLCVLCVTGLKQAGRTDVQEPAGCWNVCVCLSPHLLCSPFSSCYHLQPFKLGFTNRPNNHFKVILLAFITHLQDHVFSLKWYILDFPITFKILPSWFQMAYGWLHFCIICATSLPAACPSLFLCISKWRHSAGPRNPGI